MAVANEPHDHGVINGGKHRADFFRPDLPHCITAVVRAISFHAV